MLSAFANSLKIPDLRKRLFFTLGLIFICRIVATVPTPGVNVAVLRAAVERAQNSAGGGFMPFMDLFSGGAISNCAVGALGIMPYISASIIFQLMAAIVPALERLKREGESGQQKLNQYTRYFTIVICIVQGTFISMTLERGVFDIPGADQIVANPSLGFRIMTVLALTSGTMFVMWLGEQITERGIGNGISMIITINIISRLPMAAVQVVDMFKQRVSVFHIATIALIFFSVVAGTVAITQALRKIPIHTAKKVVGKKVYGGQNTYMPLRINYSGVMPIIFASVMLQFPSVILKKIGSMSQAGVNESFWAGLCLRAGQLLTPGENVYMMVYAVMILFFSYFWVATQFNAFQIADDLKKSGGYIPGIRPGNATAEFLDSTMDRLTFVGAVTLTMIAVLPHIMYKQFDVPFLAASFMGGTSILITVSVMLELMRQVESHLLTRHYDGFLKKGKIRGRR